MRQFGKVEIPFDAFLIGLKMNENLFLKNFYK